MKASLEAFACLKELLNQSSHLYERSRHWKIEIVPGSGAHATERMCSLPLIHGQFNDHMLPCLSKSADKIGKFLINPDGYGKGYSFQQFRKSSFYLLKMLLS